MLVKELLNKLDELAPFSLAEKWDNVGLLIGDEKASVKKILVCLDLTKEASKLADEIEADCVIMHHPLWFNSYKNLRLEGTIKPLLVEQIKKDRTLIALHTNLDACLGGVNEALGWTLGFVAGQTIIPFVANQANFLQERDPSQTLLSYYQKYNVDKKAQTGYGRLFDLAEQIDTANFYRLLKERLQAGGIITNFAEPSKYQKIALFGGAYDSMWEEQIVKLGIDCLVTGEMKHHDMISLLALGIHVYQVGHDVSERVILKPLADYLTNISEQANKDFEVLVYQGLAYPNYEKTLF